MSDTNATPAPQPAGPLTPDEDQKWAMWSHFGGILFILPPLIIWLVFKDRGVKSNTEGKESTNWQITFGIVYIALSIIISIISGIIIAAAATSLTGLGAAAGITSLLYLILFAAWVGNVILCVMGGMKVKNGGSYRYPFNFRFIK